MIVYSKNIYLEDKKISGFIKIKDGKIIDIVEYIDKSTDEYGYKNADGRIDKNIYEDMDKTLEEDIAEALEEIISKNNKENLDEIIYKALEENIKKNDNERTDKNIYEYIDKNLDKSIIKDLEESIIKNLDESISENDNENLYDLNDENLKNYILNVIKWDDDNEILNYSDFNIIPGFIDNHIHGWGTGSFWFEKSKESILEMQKHLPKEGVTSFLATTGADTIDDILKQIDEASEIYESNQIGAEMIGVHLEGPFISKEYKGMQQEENCILPNLELMKSFYNRQKSLDLIKLMTMAPELEEAKEVAEFCNEKGIQLSIGHSASTFDKIKEMKDYGFGGFTHTFSGMRGMHHRELGVAGAALYFEDMYCEFAKQTGLTVKHEAFDIALRIKTSDKIILATDCCGLAKTDKPWYHYVRKITLIPQENGVMVKHDDGREEIIDNSKYENVRDLEMSYIDSVKNIIKHSKVDMFDIMKMASINPAKYVNVFDRKGSIAINKDADLLVIDDEFNLVETIIRGKV